MSFPLRVGVQNHTKHKNNKCAPRLEMGISGKFTSGEGGGVLFRHLLLANVVVIRGSEDELTSRTCEQLEALCLQKAELCRAYLTDSQ